MSDFNLDSELNKYEGDIDFETYKLVFNFIENIIEKLENSGISNFNKFLVERLGYSAPYISKLLNGTPNLTAKKMTEIALSIGHKLTFHIEPLEQKSISIQTSEPLSDTVVTKDCLVYNIKDGKRMFPTRKIPNNPTLTQDVQYG